MKIKSWKLWLLLCALFCALTGAYFFFQSQFRLENIRIPGINVSHQPLDSQLTLDLRNILNQPFTYLDRGKQSFAFVSQDDRYVLKFFDAQCLKPKQFLRALSPKNSASCQRKLERLLAGYRLAYAQDRLHTGLLYVQLTPIDNLDLQVKLIDRFGLRHTIDLSQVLFIIQRKAVPMRILLTDLLSKGDVLGAERALRKIFGMYVEDYQRGIYDRDHNFMYNTGFIEDQPIRIDVGRLRYDEKMKDKAVYMIDLNKVVVDRLGGWLKRHFPKYRDEILADMKNFMDEGL